eukprot:evm.model.scf_534.8 EVM.evm.TU.scf_534.8   scf_534:44241-45458(-)
MPPTKRIRLQAGDSAAEAFCGAFPTIEHFLTTTEEDWKRGSGNKSRTIQGQSTDLYEIGIQYLEDHVAPPVISGTALLKSLQTTSKLLSTGCESLDNLLRGGVRGGHHTELVGPSASGKTQLCLSVALSSARRGSRVVYIDTSNSFSGSRVASINESRGPCGTPLKAVLGNITVYHSHDIFSVLHVLDELALQMSKVLDGAQLPEVLVLDSVSSVVTPVLGGGQRHSHGHTLMVSLGRMLKVVAESFGMAVVSTNHEVGGPSRPRPALGDSWLNQPHLRIHLSKVAGEADACYATVKTSAVLPRDKSTVVRLCRAGVVSAH